MGLQMSNDKVCDGASRRPKLFDGSGRLDPTYYPRTKLHCHRCKKPEADVGLQMSNDKVRDGAPRRPKLFDGSGRLDPTCLSPN